MTECLLDNIKNDIYHNWGQVKPFIELPKNEYNCYMLAVCSTIPTEVLTINKKIVSTSGENIPYFGAVGNFSATDISTEIEYLQAVVNDVETLGIKAKMYEKDFYPEKGSIKIALYSNYENGMKEEDSVFHFMRYIVGSDCWIHKSGFGGDLQRFGKGQEIEKINFAGLRRMALFELSLVV